MHAKGSISKQLNRVLIVFKKVLDLMMFVTVPSKLVKERRQFLFLKSILNEPNSSETAEDLSPHETMT